MSKSEETKDKEVIGEDNFKEKKNKLNKGKHKKHKKLHLATNEEIISYCIDNNLLYTLMLWLEIDLDMPGQIVLSGIVKRSKTALGTNMYHFTSLDPERPHVIYEIDMDDEEYKAYQKSLYNKLSMYLIESAINSASAKNVFGRYVYNKLHGKDTDDIDLTAFIYHIIKIQEKLSSFTNKEDGR